MQLEQNPFFRKSITPWYDSNLSCILLIGFMILVFLFAVVGIFLGISNELFNEYTWFPGLLAGLSFFLIVKVYYRLKNREKNN